MLGSVLTVEECATELKVTPENVLKLIESKELPAKKIGNDYRIASQNLSKYLGVEDTVSQYEIDSIKCALDKLIEHTIPKHERVKLSFVLDEILRLKAESVTSNTLEWNIGVSKHLHNYLGNYYLDELSPKIIQEFYNTVCKKENGNSISKRLLLGIRGLLTVVLKYSLDNKYISEIPTTSTIYLPKSSDPDPHKRFMDYSDINCLLELIKNSPTYTTVVRLLLMTGLRIGEALGLFWEDVDFDHHVIHVRHALVREFDHSKTSQTAYYVIGSTKTPQSIRDIPVAIHVLRLLREWKSYLYCQPKILELIRENKNSHLVFPNKEGNLQNEHTFRANFRGYLKRNGAEHLNVTFHRLRHSYGSFLLEQGEQLITVSRLLGHKNIKITADTYCAVTNRLKLKAADKTNQIWMQLN